MATPLPPLAVLAGVRTPFAKAYGSLSKVPADQLAEDETRLWPNGSPIFEEGGSELLNPEGEPLLDEATGRLVGAAQ